MLLVIILNSNLVLFEVLRKKKRKNRKVIWRKDWLKGREEKRAYSNVSSDRHRFN